MHTNTSSGDIQNIAYAALSSIGDGIITTDFSGNITYMNRPAEVILSIYAGDVIGKEFDKVVNFINLDKDLPIQSPVMNTLKKGSICGLQNNTIIETRDKLQKFVSATCSPIKLVDGSINGAILVLRDITRIKKNENINIDEKNNLITIISNVPVGMVVMDNSKAIIRVNEVALAYINQKEDLVLGKNFGEGFNCIEYLSNEYDCGNGPECTVCKIRMAIETSMREGWSSCNIEVFKTLVVDNINKDFWFKLSVTPFFMNGQNYTVVTFMDITEHKSNEKVLEESRDYNINLLNQIPSLLWRSDAGLKCNYVNKVWSDYTGTTIEKASGYGWTSLMHPDDLELFMEKRKSITSEVVPFQIQARLRRFDGIYRWCLVVGSPYCDLEGRLTGFIGSIYDINNQKEVEEELRRYRKIIDTANDIIFILDLDGRILDANKRAEEAYGYSIEELQTMNISDIRDDGSSIYFPGIGRDHGILFETVHRRRDGSKFLVEASTQEADLGDKCILLKVVRDITERKNSENKVLENQIKYRSLFMNMQAGFAYYHIIHDDKQSIIDLVHIEVNEAFENIFKVSKKDIINKTHNEVFGKSKVPLMKALSMNSYKLVNGDSIHFDDVYLSELERWFSFAYYSPKEDDLVAIITDISTMKQSEQILTAAKEAAESANKAKSEFLANMSHEIRTPINGVVGMVDLTLLTDLSEEQRDNLITAKTCANSLLKIINDVLDFSKMEAGKLIFENINFDIKEQTNH